VGKGPKRFSARRKVEIVLRLLRGEDLELLSRELGVNAARLSKWREQFLTAGWAGLEACKPGIEFMFPLPAGILPVQIPTLRVINDVFPDAVQ
jgi:transposase-like protein